MFIFVDKFKTYFNGFFVTVPAFLGYVLGHSFTFSTTTILWFKSVPSITVLSTLSNLPPNISKALLLFSNYSSIAGPFNATKYPDTFT